MQPSINKITIHNNQDLIKKLLSDLVLNPRLDLIKWSAVTRQTPNIKIGYPGQHLSSLITGVEGDRSGARGHDLTDGTEVKSCSRIDQLDKCNVCKYPVARLEPNCANCGSSDIKRNNDSKWLFSVRTEEEVAQLTNTVERVLLLLGDYPNFDSGDYNTLRFQAFEIWPNHPRSARFVELITNYYEKIYLEHRRQNASSNPAPKNFWPYSYQFYMCNPVKTFSCTVTDSETEPKLTIDHYTEPGISRADIASEIMPAKILTESELDIIANQATDDELTHALIDGTPLSAFRAMKHKDRVSVLVGIDENLRSYLSLRDTDKIATAKTAYTRRAIN